MNSFNKIERGETFLQAEREAKRKKRATFNVVSVSYTPGAIITILIIDKRKNPKGCGGSFDNCHNEKLEKY